MATVHISEAEAARDFRGLLARVRAGEEVVIGSDTDPVAVVRAAPSRRSISDCIALARKHDEESGHTPSLDPDFATDVEEIIKNRNPWTPPAWD
ncbi:MAG TPA: hypothetical protein VHU44_18775 [Acidobacteriaceae bacterium]|jgi:antitoxin (DNA-binding transcriptional repressor) of toxin-antitoxin stability system|nr:hypothetical protein [Acidobacteriaceae bacterium]